MTIEERALALVNAVQELRGHPPLARFRSDTTMAETLMQSIEAHDATLTEFEAFRRDVSDAASEALAAMVSSGTVVHERAVVGHNTIARFILPKPVDPLVDAIREASVSDADSRDAERLRAALAKRGLKLVEVGDAD